MTKQEMRIVDYIDALKDEISILENYIAWNNDPALIAGRGKYNTTAVANRVIDMAGRLGIECGKYSMKHEMEVEA